MIVDFRTTLEELCNTPGVTGSEKHTISPVVAKLMGGQIDDMGNVWKKIGNGERRVLVDAHIDEVGFRITKLGYDGAWAKFVPVGGMKIPNEQLRSRVVAGNYVGIITGGETFEKQQIDFWFYHEDEIELQTNTIAYYERKFHVSEKKEVTSPALDNRTSTTVLCALGQTLEPVNKWSIYLIGSVHHEQGGASGLQTFATKVGPEIIFGLDSAYAKSYGPEDEWWGIPELGKGPAIQVSGKGYVADEDLVHRLVGLAESHRIPYQWEIPDPDNGGLGISHCFGRKIAVNIPVKNQHTPVSQCSLYDIENSYNLVLAFLTTIDNGV
jgi:endoglucanase